MIYLVSNTPYDDNDIVWLNLCKIKFFKFDVNLNKRKVLPMMVRLIFMI